MFLFFFGIGIDFGVGNGFGFVLERELVSVSVSVLVLELVLVLEISMEMEMVCFGIGSMAMELVSGFWFRFRFRFCFGNGIGFDFGFGIGFGISFGFTFFLLFLLHPILLIEMSASFLILTPRVPVIVVSLVSFSRISLAVHYPHDIVAGAIMGLLFLKVWRLLLNIDGSMQFLYFVFTNSFLIFNFFNLQRLHFDSSPSAWALGAHWLYSVL
jgi:hypothetical protein